MYLIHCSHIQNKYLPGGYQPMARV